MSSAGQRAGAPRVLAERYRLDKVIGRGGMSTVYRGTDLALDRVVAVKVALDPLAEENPIYVARFKREARAAAALNHPGVVTVFDAGADGPTRFIVMECVEGQSLAEILREQGPLEPVRAAGIAAQIADTLAAAHAAGVIHRDIKPGNAMIAADGPPGSPDESRERVKVLDFGIARTADAVTLTQTASVLGTAPYMAPEQAMGQPADARSDIYALGCVLYEMLTGKPPFTGDVPAAVLHQHVRVAAKPPSALNPAIPQPLDAITLEMLAKKPEDRPQTAAAVRDRLAAFQEKDVTAPTAPLAAEAKPLPPVIEAAAAVAAVAADVPQIATVPQAATIPAEATEPTAATRLMPPPARPPRRAPWAILAALSVLLLGAAVALAVTGSFSSSSHSASQTTQHRAAPPLTHSTPAAPATSRASSTPTTSSSTTATTTTTVTTTATQPGPPGGTPPGQAKKDKQGKKK